MQHLSGAVKAHEVNGRQGVVNGSENPSILTKGRKLKLMGI